MTLLNNFDTLRVFKINGASRTHGTMSLSINIGHSLHIKDPLQLFEKSSVVILVAGFSLPSHRKSPYPIEIQAEGTLMVLPKKNRSKQMKSTSLRQSGNNSE